MHDAKKRLINFLNRYGLISSFLQDSFASGYKVRTVNRMVATIKETELLEDGIIIHKERQRTKVQWHLYSKLWQESLVTK